MMEAKKRLGQMNNTRRYVSIAVFTALIAVGGFISVPFFNTGIEISLQTLFVVIAGLFLGARDGALAVLIYLAMGLLGLPVFTQGGGIAYVVKPSFGYLMGFPIGAAVAGAICPQAKKPTRGRAFVASLAAMLPIYIIGVTYQELILHYYMGVEWTAIVAALPSMVALLLKDAAVCGLAATLYPRLRRALGVIQARGKKRESVPLPGAVAIKK